MYRVSLFAKSPSLCSRSRLLSSWNCFTRRIKEYGKHFPRPSALGYEETYFVTSEGREFHFAVKTRATLKADHLEHKEKCLFELDETFLCVHTSFNDDDECESRKACKHHLYLSSFIFGQWISRRPTSQKLIISQTCVYTTSSHHSVEKRLFQISK